MKICKIKNSKVYNYIYYKIIYNLLYKLCRINNKKMIFSSVKGLKYSCNPRAIYEYLEDNYKEFQYVWIIKKNSNNSQYIEKLEKSKNTIVCQPKTIKAAFHYVTSKYWVNNIEIPVDIIPKKDTVIMQTWHAGGAFKKFGMDIPWINEKAKDNIRNSAQRWDILLCSSNEIVDIYRNAFDYDKMKIHPIGLPRNDIFYNKKKCENIKDEFYNKYNINNKKKIILYAPTFLDNEKKFDFDLNIQRMKDKLGEKYILLVKLHPRMGDLEGLDEKLSMFVKDFSWYDDIQDLLIVSDVLITDYSSVIFDYAINKKPMIFYPRKFKEFNEECRGFYYCYEEFVPGPIVYNTDEIIELLENYEKLYINTKQQIESFGEKFNYKSNGKSTEKAVSLLLNYKK